MTMTSRNIGAVAEDRWPGLLTPRSAPIRAAVARRIVRHAVRSIPVTVHFPNGTTWGAGTDADPAMEIHRPVPFFHRLGSDVQIGFGEAYMTGDWAPADGTDLADLLTPFAARAATLVPPALQRLRRFAEPRMPSHHDQTVDHAPANVRHHYDLSNDLFATFLDETMTYSSARFAGPGDDLASAQRRKIDSILDAANVGRGCELLEIGTGWGQLAIQAAQRGATVTSVTLSEEQAVLARQRVAEARLADRVTVHVRDYRDVRGDFDAIVSVEMIEAVGLRYIPEFFATLDRLLRPGGRIGLQAITMAHDRMLASRDAYTWIRKYIFPGGLVPSMRLMDEAMAEHTGLTIVGRQDFGMDYARTLREWRTRFLDRWQTIARLGFDDVFKRMWELYLAYSEAGFRSGHLDVTQLTIAHR